MHSHGGAYEQLILTLHITPRSCEHSTQHGYLTGVQLEVGETASSFEHKSYADYE